MARTHNRRQMRRLSRFPRWHKNYQRHLAREHCRFKHGLQRLFLVSWSVEWRCEFPSSLTRAGLPRLGTSLYIYCILANQVAGADTNTFLDIFIDDEKVSSFEHMKDASTTDYQYNVPVFANATLSVQNEQHYVVIANKASSASNSLIMFDYAVYTCVAWLSTSYQPTNALAASPIMLFFPQRQRHQLPRALTHPA